MRALVYLLLRLPNAVFSLSPAWSRRPVIYDRIEPICGELARLEQSFAVIKAEYRALSDKLSQVPRYHEVDRLQYNLSSSRSEAQNWRVFFLEAMGRKAVSNRKLCPQTAALVDAIPGVFEAFFSILEGGKSLAPHRSPYWGYLRYHLALEVPQTLPSPRMRVNDRWLSWQEGKGILFDDSWEHELRNENPNLRSVLIVDIARPMSAPAQAINRFCIFLMRHTYARWLLRPHTV